MSKIPTPHGLLELILGSAFRQVDLSPVLTLEGDELRQFTLGQMERLRATEPNSISALWLSDQFWTSNLSLILCSEPHPWLEVEAEMKSRQKLSDLTDDEYRIAEWIVELALFSHDLYTHQPFDTDLLGDGLKGKAAETEIWEDSFAYANQPLVEWIRTTTYRHIAAMACATMMEQELDWAIRSNQAVQDYYATECDRAFHDFAKLEDCEDYIKTCLDAMQRIKEHYEQGRGLGLSDEEIRVLDCLMGFAPHHYAEEDIPFAREVCEAANKHLPPRPYIKSEQGQKAYGKAVFADIKKIFAKYDVPYDPSNLTDLTPGYLDAWVYDKYYNE